MRVDFIEDVEREQIKPEHLGNSKEKERESLLGIWGFY